MSAGKYINADPVSSNKLSRVGCALLLPLMLLADKDNMINKKSFTKSVGWIRDYRTWNKYWTELVKENVLVRLDKKIWMVSPYECYTGGVSRMYLINKWDEARDADYTIS